MKLLEWVKARQGWWPKGLYVDIFDLSACYVRESCRCGVWYAIKCGCNGDENWKWYEGLYFYSKRMGEVERGSRQSAMYVFDHLLQLFFYYEGNDFFILQILYNFLISDQSWQIKSIVGFSQSYISTYDISRKTFFNSTLPEFFNFFYT